jgi:Glutathione S-transferase, N-terminal domain
LSACMTASQGTGRCHFTVPSMQRITPTITAFERSPDRGKGLARDMRVGWALEEVGQPYDVRLLSFSEMKESAHRMLHPFGQIPTYEEGDLTLFESGAIISNVRPHMYEASGLAASAEQGRNKK